jgi:hypothetical protein
MQNSLDHAPTGVYTKDSQRGLFTCLVVEGVFVLGVGVLGLE